MLCSAAQVLVFLENQLTATNLALIKVLIFMKSVKPKTHSINLLCQSKKTIFSEHTCSGGVALATIKGFGPGSLNIVSTSWSPTSNSMSIAPGGQLGEWAGEAKLGGWL